MSARLFDAGRVIWLIMKSSKRRLRWIGMRAPEKAGGAHSAFLEALESHTEADCSSALRVMSEGHPELQLQRHIVEAILGEDEEGPGEHPLLGRLSRPGLDGLEGHAGSRFMLWS